MTSLIPSKSLLKWEIRASGCSCQSSKLASQSLFLSYSKNASNLDIYRGFFHIGVTCFAGPFRFHNRISVFICYPLAHPTRIRTMNVEVRTYVGEETTKRRGNYKIYALDVDSNIHVNSSKTQKILTSSRHLQLSWNSIQMCHLYGLCSTGKSNWNQEELYGLVFCHRTSCPSSCLRDETTRSQMFLSEYFMERRLLDEV